MNEKIVLIRPENVYKYNNYPPLGLISIASQLKSDGFDVKIINCAFETDWIGAISRELPGALLVGVTMLTSEVVGAHAILKFIKDNFTVPVAVGGWHCTLFPEQTAESELIDYVIAGEGEQHMSALAKSLRAGIAPADKLFAKERLDPDALPMPDYAADPHIEQFINSYLTDKLSEYVPQPMRWLPYQSSRGCPSRCTFCINVVTDNTRYRKKSAQKVLAEIEFLVNEYRLTHLKIVDDNFFVDIKRVREVCEGLIAMDRKFTWDAECRCDYFNDRMLNDETLALAKKAGLNQLTLGIESGSPETLKIMKKGITVEQARNAVKKCDEHAIIARSSFILDVPGDSLANIKQTIALINELRRYPYFTCGVGTFRPYPKCELTEKLLEQGYLKEPQSFDDWTNSDVIDLYTSAEYVRPWQVNGRYSESAAFYLNIESAVRLGNHQIDRTRDKLANNVFRLLAKARNRLGFYGLPVDSRLYKRFLTRFYQRRQDLEKSGAYPLSKKASAERK